VIANILSSSRFFLALLFFFHDPVIRVTAIFLAMISDVLDGFFARRMNQVSKLGTLLDPASDKFFVASALFIFFTEGRVHAGEISAFLAREIALVLFSLYLVMTHTWSSYTIRAFIAGKVMTSLQFIVLIGLAAGWEIPRGLFWAMGGCGVLCLVELLLANVRRDAERGKRRGQRE